MRRRSGVAGESSTKKSVAPASRAILSATENLPSASTHAGAHSQTLHLNQILMACIDASLRTTHVHYCTCSLHAIKYTAAEQDTRGDESIVKKYSSHMHAMYRCGALGPA